MSSARLAVMMVLLMLSAASSCSHSPYRCASAPRPRATDLALAASDVKELVDAVNNGLGLGTTLLNLFHWPLQRGSDLLAQSLSVISALISWFNFLASFVVPGGTGAGVLAWLRGTAPTKRAFTIYHLL